MIQQILDDPEHFYFQAEDGIRDLTVTGVQTCALPIQVVILINMAGVLLEGPLDRIKPSDWKWMLKTNLLGPVRTTTALLPHMKDRRSGHVINTVSADGPAPHDPLTIASDAGHAALASFTRSLAAELDGTGVNVSLYCTGSKGPRIGENTRTRGVGRLLHPDKDLDEASKPSGQLIDSLIDAVHHPRFLVLAERGRGTYRPTVSRASAAVSAPLRSSRPSPGASSRR